MHSLVSRFCPSSSIPKHHCGLATGSVLYSCEQVWKQILSWLCWKELFCSSCSFACFRLWTETNPVPRYVFGTLGDGQSRQRVIFKCNITPSGHVSFKVFAGVQLNISFSGTCCCINGSQDPDVWRQRSGLRFKGQYVNEECGRHTGYVHRGIV